MAITETRIKVALVLLVTLLPSGCNRNEERPREAAVATPPAAGAQSAPATTDAKRLYCNEHTCYEDECFLCHAELREEGRLWCQEHTRYEDRCFICHPDLRDTARAFCEKHFLYDDECFLCHPDLKSKPTSSVPTSSDSKRLMCEEHGVPEEECGICHPESASKLESGDGLKVRFPSIESAAKAGIETATPRVASMVDGVDCYAEIAFNQNKLAHIAVPLSGIVQSVDVDLGSAVREGTVLARIWSAEIGQAVANAVLTHQTVLRERELRAEEITSERELQEAEAADATARQQLKTLGFNSAQIEALASQSVETAMLEIRAPFAGEIVERNAVRGALVEAGASIFTLTDRSTMWAMLSIPEERLSLIQVGQRVELTFDALPSQTFTGKLAWISAQVDDRTRMAQARAEIADPDKKLRAKMYGRARVLIDSSGEAVVVSQSAIQCLENRDFVFVKLADDLFEARSVRIGAKHNGSVVIAEGLRPDELVVVAGGFTAKSQFLLSRLGAGCVDD